ncbi:membrane protein [Candidatus Endoriftia persephone str. Guaymas]|jgi:uncharacterized protein YcfJ|uniref:Outer membrane lipoprotein n=4 Tax=Gammaproteobacteria TaxID=1236 RepID=G2DD75_9GAMM|nr:glycine zipper 2TM domain-containing protein [Candidatus Endoriftia persephone]MBA1330950.1 membrane protein [Candidatus Endoriftia persephone str. Guaymas]EGV51454.1 outer membrane lipoprotein [endosymbiont of Riftia pachyptila (vent Ph05)]EGW53355.1 putative outer membrane lipoprotein [endosymbiont of Tevnia jerichonana (vent Tica)]KRT54730.1 hypothetical protein Ga0074115_10935 [endosymbiont of Ridgeia piscesae]KRT57538.1 putative conserved protein YcfJ, contains glycine zipper 2TM domai
MLKIEEAEMKKTTIAIATLLLSASLSVNAGWKHRYQDTAKVIDVDPIYKTVEISRPERHCWDEQVSHYRPNRDKSYTGTVLGGIVGGVVGNQFGKGKGKDAATIAGALLGASVGHDASRNRSGHYVTETERRCEVIDYTEQEEQLVGYRVKYRYKGQVFTTRTKSHPGKHIRVRVAVTPIDEL